MATLALVTGLAAALVGGIFFAFSTFVMTALGRLPAARAIAAMQSINVAVLNPWFFAAFFGTAAASIALALFGLLDWGAPEAVYLVSGSLLYLLGCLLVTVVFNVPLNHGLAGVEPGSAVGAEVWGRYLSAWTTWNHVRTAASLAAAAAFVMAPG